MNVLLHKGENCGFVNNNDGKKAVLNQSFKPMKKTEKVILFSLITRRK